MENLLTANILLDIFCIILCLMPILYLTTSHRYKYKSNRYFMGVCISNAFMILGDLGDWAIRDTTEFGARTLLIVLTIIYYICSALVLFFVSNYIKEYLKVTKQQSRWFTTSVEVLCLVQIAVAISSPFAGFAFFINEKGYQRGSLFFLSQAAPFVIIGLCIIFIAVNRKKLTSREIFIFNLYLLLSPFAILIQVMLRGINIVSPVATLNMLILFINIQYEQELLLHLREKELAELRIDILLSQIQPHFLYNVLATISHLCRRDPDKARKAIREFSVFLRGNMDSLNNRRLIPFEQEMNHLMSYLSLEQQRFQERLKVVYDIKVKEFAIPPLTLQPIAENAVRHGILYREEGGVITVATREEQDDYIVSVKDTGVGIEKAKMYSDVQEDSHIGLKNVRSRIQMMMHGRLEVESCDSGTTVTIYIPKEKL